jgi:uncharacterized protein (DUF433 family)
MQQTANLHENVKNIEELYRRVKIKEMDLQADYDKLNKEYLQKCIDCRTVDERFTELRKS